MSNKTSDKNVANEEITNSKNKYAYIKKVAERIVNEYREKYKRERFYPEPSEQTDMAYKILSLLAEREQDKKRIKELEEEIAMLKRASNIAKEVNIEDVTDVINKSCKEFMSNYIAKQVVIDKMEELNKEIKNGDEIEAIFKIKQQQILQELLERGNK